MADDDDSEAVYLDRRNRQMRPLTPAEHAILVAAMTAYLDIVRAVLPQDNETRQTAEKLGESVAFGLIGYDMD